MTATVALERQQAELSNELGPFAVFRGHNLLRFVISGWPKLTQQFVGLAVFNTYATYFCESALPQSASLLLLTTFILSPICRKQGPLPRHTYPFIRPAHLDAPHRNADRSAWSSPAHGLSIRPDCCLCAVSGYYRMLRL